MKDARTSDYPESVIAETDNMIAKGNLVRAIGGAAYLEAARDERIADKQGTFTGSEVGDSVLESKEASLEIDETDEDAAYGLITSKAPARFHIPAQTRVSGFEKVKKIKARIQNNLDKK